MMQYIYSVFFLIFFSWCNAQQAKPFQFYNQKGKPVEFDKVVKTLATYDVVLFGEHHNNSTNHWLQLRLAKSLYKLKGKELILGAEMFERDNQIGINRYLSNATDLKQLKDEVRLWSNHSTDYQPLIDFSKSNHLPFIATNVPRKYASLVAKQGIEELNNLAAEEKEWMVKLPFPIDYSAPGYPEMMQMMGEHAGAKAKQFVAAQAIKDATMAESILNNIKPDQLFLHINGDYHSKQYGGIYWYLKNYQPKLKVAVIQIVESNDEALKLEIPKEGHFILTDFTLVLPEDTIKTY